MVRAFSRREALLLRGVRLGRLVASGLRAGMGTHQF